MLGMPPRRLNSAEPAVIAALTFYCSREVCATPRAAATPSLIATMRFRLNIVLLNILPDFD